MHLDFHTSENIPEIGKNFSKENFQNALKVGACKFDHFIFKMSSWLGISSLASQRDASGAEV